MTRRHNQTMGGVDRTDQNAGKLRTVIRSKKLWWLIFAFCLVPTIQQAWHLYKSTDAAQTSPLHFCAIRRNIVRVYYARTEHARPVILGDLCDLTR